MTKWVPIESDDVVFTIKEFITLCECKALMDYDGWGYYARNVQRNKWDGQNYTGEKLNSWDHIVIPSMVANYTFNMKYTHIIWYNR